jgi:hypothetical protein
MREIETVRIHDIPSYFAEVVPRVKFNLPPIYRGQADGRWDLIPSLMRESLPDTQFNSWIELESNLLHRFKQDAFSSLPREPQCELEWLSIAQDVGLPTRLSAWTDQALTALFFATAPTADQADGVVYRIIPGDESFVISQDFEQIPHSANLYQPKLSSPTMRAQGTCFLSHPLPEFDTAALSFEDHFLTGDDAMNLTKIVIPAAEKADLRRALCNLNTDPSRLFPGVQGIAARIASEIYSHTDSYDWMIAE